METVKFAITMIAVAVMALCAVAVVIVELANWIGG
jgi:hypothetical protein